LTPVSPLVKPIGRWLLSGLAAVGLTLLLNRFDVWWLGATVFTTDSFYDGCAALMTLAIPALLGGALGGFIARADALNAAAITFVLFCFAGFLRPFWRIPPVSPEAAHSGAIHYFLYSPLVALAFGALGAWAAGQFATGKWTLADAEPVVPPG